MKPYKFGRSNGRRWGRFALFFGLIVLILGLAGYFGFRNIYERGLQPVDENATDTIAFTLENGASVSQIANGLSDKGLIRSSSVFVQYVRNHNYGESLQAGTYSLKKSYDVPTIVDYFINGKVDVNLFTILPGSSLTQIKAAFIENGFSEAEVDAALNPAAYAGHPALVDKPEGASLEGYLYPDSYYMMKGETTASEVIGLALDEMAQALTPDVRAGISAQGLSVYQGIILASIVEKEVGDRDVSGKPSDNRTKVAQVFLKRLKIGMALQSNATDTLPESYDTYQITGLPPGPISNVSSSALGAVARPASTDFLYFVSGCDAVTRFGQTIEQHEAFIRDHGVADTDDCSTP